MDNLGDALVVTLIGMLVIFAVLAILWISIILLEKVFPYKEPALVEEDNLETIAVIQAAISGYLKRRK